MFSLRSDSCVWEEYGFFSNSFLWVGGEMILKPSKSPKNVVELLIQIRLLTHSRARREKSPGGKVMSCLDLPSQH